MSLPLDQLPDDIDALKRLVVANDAELIAASAELAAKTDEVVAARSELEVAQGELIAAKNGLLVTQLTIEHLKAQLAKLRREKFGASSERIEREIAQLELKLEDAQTAQAEAAAPAAPTAEPDPEPTSQKAPSPEAPAPEKKKRRTLPPELPRRDVVHAPAEVCKACGGHDLRPVGESVTEILEYIPGRFEVVRHVRPACSCAKCETHARGVLSARRCRRRCRTCRFPVAWRARASWPTSQWPSSATTFRSTDKPRSTRAPASTSTEASSPIGLATSHGS